MNVLLTLNYHKSYFIYVAVWFLFQEFEASFIRLLDTMTNGSTIVVNETGLWISSYSCRVTCGNLSLSVKTFHVLTSMYCLFLGTVVFYQPGMLSGGAINHDCSTQRSIGYYLEAVLSLAPFTKKPLQCVFRGVTNDQHDPSVSLWMQVNHVATCCVALWMISFANCLCYRLTS